MKTVLFNAEVAERGLEFLNHLGGAAKKSIFYFCRSEQGTGELAQLFRIKPARE